MSWVVCFTSCCTLESVWAADTAGVVLASGKFWTPAESLKQIRNTEQIFST